MNKTIIKYILIFLFFVSNAYSEVVNKIEISGNKRISNETIIVLGQISSGKNINDTDLNNILKELYNTNFFSDVKVILKNNTLSINVIENPIIEDIQITGVKNKTFIENILDSISLKNRMSYNEFQLKNDVNLINNILKTNGFYFSKVDPLITKNDQLNSVRLKINIDRGKKTRIKEIVFLGDKKLKDKKLLEVIASEEHKFWKFVSNKVYLNESLINLDKRLLENYYKNLGYYNVKVINSFAELRENDSFKLVFNIDAGEKFYFDKLTLSLPEDYKKKDFEKVEKIFTKLEKKIYSLDKINKILDEIDKIASLKLYDFIDANIQETTFDGNKISFEFNIVDSEKFYVERINILGNFNTIEEVIRNRLIVDEGDPLNELLFNKSVDSIRSLGIFKSVKSEITQGSDPNLKIVNLEVVEKPTGEISLAAGVGTGGSTIGGGITKKTFLEKV